MLFRYRLPTAAGLCKRALLAFAIACGAQVSPASATEARVPQRLSLDDVLSIESFGESSFSPDGTRLAVERVASMAARPASLYESSTHDKSVHVVELETGSWLEVRGPDPEVRHSLAPWGAAFSPDGRFLALRALTAQRAGFALWDAATRTMGMLPGEMQHAHYASAWTHDGRYIYASAAPGAGMVSRPAFAQRLMHRWSEVWNASSPQVLVMSSNPAVAQDRSPQGRLMMARASNGATVEISAGNYSRIVVSPDGRRFAAVRVGLPTAKQTFSFSGTGELEVFALTESGAQLEASFPEMDIAWQQLAWSPDSRKLAVGGHPVASTDASAGKAMASAARLYVYDVHARRLSSAGLDEISLDQTDSDVGFTIAPTGWLGNVPLAIGISADSTTGGSPLSERESRGYDVGASARSDLWAVTPRGPRNLTRFAHSSIRTFADPAGYGAVFVVADGALWRLRLDAAPERMTPLEGPRVLGFSVLSRAGSTREAFAEISAGNPRRVVQLLVEHDGMQKRMTFDLRAGAFAETAGGRALSASKDHSRTLLLRDAGYAQALALVTSQPAHAGALRELARVNEALNGRASGEIVALDYPLGGRDFRSWLVLPPEYDRSKPLPAVLWVYGGTVWKPGAPVPRSARLDYDIWLGHAQLIAAQGYAVIEPSLPIEPGAHADVPALLAEEAIAAVDAAAAKGLVDPRRVAVMGHSFGGYTTAAILSRRSDRFRAGVATSGIYDWIASYGSTYLRSSLAGEARFWRDSMDYIESVQINLREPPWRAAEAYIRNSPFFSVEHLDAPLMIMQNDLDLDVSSLYGAEHMYAALVRAGKQPVFVHYWGEGHGTRSVPNIRDQWARVVEWLEHHLGR